VIDGAGAVVLGGLFALGCIAIHVLRGHARRLTPVLSLVVICLGPFTGLVALALGTAHRQEHAGPAPASAPVARGPIAPDPPAAYGFQ